MPSFPVNEDSRRAFSDDHTQRENCVVRDCDLVQDMLRGKQPINEDFLAVFAAQEVNDLCRKSELVNEDAEARIPRFDKRELSTGHILGKGGYSIVREISVVTLFKPKSRENSTKHFGNVLRSSMCRRNSFGSSAGYRRNSNDFSNVARTYPMRESNFEFPNQEPQDPSCESTGAESFDWDEDEMMKQVHDRAFIANHCMRGGEARYAVKKLHSSYDTDPRQHFNGIVDLAVEARFLAFVRHPNIIRLRAMSLGDPYKPGFFILMDRLYDTLGERISKWSERERKTKGFVARLKGGGKKLKNDLLAERLVVMNDIALALKHLHFHDVLYRDLKPENLGFDLKGRIKLFDFGLAVELRSEDMLNNGTYNIPQGGTRRYMSPETANKKPCNCSADIYSFGILFWSVLALETPFKGFTAEKHSELVLRQGFRPKISSSWPLEIKSLLPKCWSENIWKRPKCEVICEVLNELTRNLSEFKRNSLDLSFSSNYSLWNAEDNDDYQGISTVSRFPQ